MKSIERLCEWAQVSRSGFYKYLNRIKLTTNKELSDREDFEYILEAYNHRGYKKGSCEDAENGMYFSQLK